MEGREADDHRALIHASVVHVSPTHIPIIAAPVRVSQLDADDSCTLVELLGRTRSTSTDGHAVPQTAPDATPITATARRSGRIFAKKKLLACTDCGNKIQKLIVRAQLTLLVQNGA